MTIHIGDDFSRQDWDPPLSKPESQPQTEDDPDHLKVSENETNWDQAATDATNVSMLESGSLQPEDL